MLFRRCMLISKRTLCSLPQKTAVQDRQLILQSRNCFEKTKSLFSVSSVNRSIFTTSNFGESKDEDEVSKLEKNRIAEMLSAKKFQTDDSISAESMQTVDVETATFLYEDDVAQNKSFSEADLKAGDHDDCVVPKT